MMKIEKIMDWEHRYEMDFIRMPLLIHRAKREVIDLIMNGSYLAMTSLYNKGWPGGRTNRFTPDDFKCRRIQDGPEIMIYITLPATDARARMASTHMAITYYDPPAGYADFRVFNVERSNSNTTAIGEMQFTAEGRMQSHTKYGEAAQSDDENIRRIWGIAFDAA